MERLDERFATYRDALQARLAARIAPLTRSLFRDLPARDANAIASLVGGGKQLRGTLVLAVCDALGGDVDAALASAAAVECVHAASLIHDDLVDGDRTRRERPAAWVVHGRRRAVLLADVIFATALERSAELGRHEVRSLARAISMLAAGAYGEPLHPRDVDVGDVAELYERTIRLKTGSLFAAAAELGAMAAAAGRARRTAAFDFGARVGEAYQIADDLVDVFRSPGPASAQRLATLAAVVGRFGAPRRDGERDRIDAAAITRAMEAEIERRLQLAGDALARLGSGASMPMLRRMPEAIVGTMLAAPAPPIARFAAAPPSPAAMA